ncbi:MAG: lipoprotein insertase outer membrane protein LolB [Thermomonas sp.]
MKSLRRFLIVAVAVLASACAMQPAKPTLPPLVGAPEANQAARAAKLAASPNWSMSGRIAVTNGQQGGSGRIEWKQDGARYTATLSAPVTRQSWRVSGGPEGATIEGMAGGPRQGPDAAALVFEATHWQVPVDALSEWLFGLERDGDTVHFGADGRVDRIEGKGWVVDYSDWRQVEGVELPGRIEAVQGTAKVRLVVDGWTLGTGTP